jgi:hypothetical protein
MADKILLVDDTLTDLTEKRSDLQNDKTRYISPSDLVNEGNGGYTYTEVAVTSPQILAKDQITLLAAPGANTYYDIDRIIFEYNYGTSAYINQNPQGIYLTQGRDFILINGDIIEGSVDNVAIARHGAPYNTDISAGDAQNPIEFIQTNEAVTMDYYDGGTITNGDGTLLIKIWYKTKTIGTEL